MKKDESAYEHYKGSTSIMTINRIYNHFQEPQLAFSTWNQKYSTNILLSCPLQICIQINLSHFS